MFNFHKPSPVKKTIRLLFTGFSMGAADIVPGVSGGTVALLFGIYEELIQTIKEVSGQAIRLALKGKIKEAWDMIPFGFLVPLAVGLFTAVATLSSFLSYLLSTYPQFLWALFFGLILASVYVVSKRVVTWNTHDYIAAAIATIGAFILVGAVPVETPNTLPALFISGAIAICAMILPGVSGSFLLVIMGKYEQVLSLVNNREIVPLVVFMMGAVVGLALFSRLLSYLFKKHHDIIVAILSGFMLGSLRKVWPWKEVLSTRINSHGEVVPLVERNILPSTLTTDVLFSILLFLIGVGVVILISQFDATKERVEDIDDKQFAKEHKKALKSQKSNKI